MEEKILVKSERYNIQKIFMIICVIGLIIGLITPIAIHGAYAKYVHGEFVEYSEMYEEAVKKERYDSAAMWIERMDTYERSYKNVVGEMVMIAVVIAFSVAAVGGVLYYAWSRIELVVSDKRVYGCAAFGKRVDLPIDSVSAIASKWPKGIAVATSSGKIAFLMIKNHDEIHKCVSDLLIERQSKPVTVAAPTPIIKQEVPQSNAEELKKYKELLDMGVISQEEFDAKKKQLLGL